MTTQPSDWAVATLREIAGGTTILTRYQCQQMHKAIDILARELDASGGGQEPFAYMPANIVESVATNRRLGNESVFDARTRRHHPGDAPLYATPRAAEAATTNSAQISSSLVAGDAVKAVLDWQPLTHLNKGDRLYQILEAAGLPFDDQADSLRAAVGAVGAGGGE